MNKNGLRPCAIKCQELNVKCPCKECRLWIDFEDDLNCTLIAVDEHGSMTLREIAERLGVSFARVKQIETKALQKIKNTNILSCFEN
jgi:hypothetical protein